MEPGGKEPKQFLSLGQIANQLSLGGKAIRTIFQLKYDWTEIPYFQLLTWFQIYTSECTLKKHIFIYIHNHIHTYTLLGPLIKKCSPLCLLQIFENLIFLRQNLSRNTTSKINMVFLCKILILPIVYYPIVKVQNTGLLFKFNIANRFRADKTVKQSEF